MKLKSAIIISLLLVMILAVAGCTTTPGGVGTTTTTTTTTVTTTITTSVGPGTVLPCSRDTVSRQVLQGFLPSAQSGGQVVSSTSMSMQAPGEGCDYAWAETDYSHGDLEVTVMIYDFNYYTGITGSVWADAYTTDESYAKPVMVYSYLGWEMGTTTGDQDIQLWVDIGNGIFVRVYVDGTSDTGLLYQYTNAINYDGLAGLV